MNALLARLRREAGQAMVFMVFGLLGFVGMAALVIDGGSWLRAQRQLQTAADAGALAGVQELPLNQALARTTAESYAQQNYPNNTVSTNITWPSAGEIDVVANTTAPGFFSRIYGAVFNDVDVRAHARAGVYMPEKLKRVAPIGIHKDYACIVSDPGCFGQTLTLDFTDDDNLDPTSSKYGLLDLDRVTGAGAGDMKKWLEDGYPDALPIDTMYPPGNGQKNGLKNELEDLARDQTEILIPIFDYAVGDPDGYHVVGWAAFVIDEVVKWGQDDDPGNHVIKGHFVTYIASDLAAGNPITDPDNNFGVKVFTLTE
jgi:Putative Flp pilus-assembly TadE/G-like